MELLNERHEDIRSQTSWMVALCTRNLFRINQNSDKLWQSPREQSQGPGWSGLGLWNGSPASERWYKLQEQGVAGRGRHVVHNFSHQVV